MPTREILNSHPVQTLRKEISKTNIKGYSKLKKGDLVSLMLKHKDRFQHIKSATKKSKSVGTHKMPDGTVMTGKTHSKDSKPVKKETYKIKRKAPAPNKPSKPVKKETYKIKRKAPAPKSPAGFKSGDKVKFKKKNKKEPNPELKKFTGLSKADANKLEPAKLFGMLPPELRKNILNPKNTGVVVGKKDLLTDEAISLVNECIDTVGFEKYAYNSTLAWSYYEGGNFNEKSGKFFQKQSDRLPSFASGDLRELLENDRFEKACINSHKQMGSSGEFIFKDKDWEDRLDEEGDDRQDYYLEDTYGLIYEDGDWNMSNRTRSTVRELTTGRVNILKKSKKEDFAPLKKLIKSGKAFI